MIQYESATVEIAATLSIPHGTGRHNERAIVRACADCAAFILSYQYVPTWGWDAMKVTTTYGDFGRCYQCRETAVRKHGREVVAMRER